ncbi:hypothetical protein CUR21_03360 [Pseudorhodobacter sp. MZDSW-24AT]|nr:hypothetical protein CUR21_03360 [Pseudorhodobacter sp. MZDSW-24AT]
MRNQLRLEANADTSLFIANGGEVIYTSPETGRTGAVILGSYADFIPGSGTTTTTVTGEHSYLEINGRLELGFGNALSDDMTISEGARVVVQEPDDFEARVDASFDPTEASRGGVSLGGFDTFAPGQALDTLTITGVGSELVYSSNFFTNSGNNRILVIDGGVIRQNEVGDVDAVAAFLGINPDDLGAFSLGSGVGESSLLVDGPGSAVSVTRNIQIGYGEALIGYENPEEYAGPIFGPTSAQATVVNGGLMSTTKDVVVSKSGEPGTGYLTVGSGGRVEASRLILNDGGVLSGNGGTIVGDVILDGGMISPGASPGSMTIDGDLEVFGGSLFFEVGGGGAGMFDQLFVTGDLLAMQGLSITLSLIDGFLPERGTVFDFLKVSGSASIFDTPELISVSFLGINGSEFALGVTNNGFSGTYVGENPVSPVPLPSGLLLLVTAFGVMGLLSGRRKATVAV